MQRGKKEQKADVGKLLIIRGIQSQSKMKSKLNSKVLCNVSAVHSCAAVKLWTLETQLPIWNILWKKKGCSSSAGCQKVVFSVPKSHHSNSHNSPLHMFSAKWDKACKNSCTALELRYKRCMSEEEEEEEEKVSVCPWRFSSSTGERPLIVKKWHVQPTTDIDR